MVSPQTQQVKSRPVPPLQSQRSSLRSCHYPFKRSVTKTVCSYSRFHGSTSWQCIKSSKIKDRMRITRLKLPYTTFLLIITSLFSLMTTDNLFLSFIFPKSWTVLTTQLGGFNQGISNPWQYHYQGNTLWLLSTELLKPLVPNVVMIKRMNKGDSCTIVRPTAIPSHH